jgi:hypothetical protein
MYINIYTIPSNALYPRRHADETAHMAALVYEWVDPHMACCA